MHFIIVLISLFLGYVQGIKHRKRKVKKEILQLQEEIMSLKSALKDEQRKNRLSMFDVNKRIKGNQSMLEEKMVVYFSKYDSKLDFRKIISLIQYIMDKWNNDLIHMEAQIKISDINDIYNTFKEIDNSMTRPISIRIKSTDDLRIQTVAIRDIFSYVIQFLYEIDIENYDISYSEFLNAMSNISDILYA